MKVLRSFSDSIERSALSLKLLILRLCEKSLQKLKMRMRTLQRFISGKNLDGKE